MTIRNDVNKRNSEKCLTQGLSGKFKQLWHLVGNTPMLKLCYDYKGKPFSIYVKCEHYNLTGNVKDRLALYILYQVIKTVKSAGPEPGTKRLNRYTTSICRSI